MNFDRDYEPEYDSLKTLLLEMSQEHAVAPLLGMIVRQLAHRPHVALARIWLIKEGDCPPARPGKRPVTTMRAVSI